MRPPEERPAHDRLLLLTGRQQALAEILFVIRRSTAVEGADPDLAYPRLKEGWRTLHAWMEEAGRENRLELDLLRREAAKGTPVKTASFLAWLKARLGLDRAGTSRLRR